MDLEWGVEVKKILLIIITVLLVSACGSGVNKRGSYNELATKAEEIDKEKTKEIYKNVREEEVTKMPPIEDFFPEEVEEENKYTSSLWGTERKSLYADSKASQKGDIIFVVVDEEVTAEINYSLEKSGYTDYTSKTKAESEASENGDSKRGDIANKKTDSTIAGTEEKTDLPNTEDFNGEGNSKRKLIFDGKITARVEGVDKYGNLYIKGSKLALVNNETVLLEISGYIRNRDIKTDNTVSSENIDNLEFTYNGAMYLGKPVLKEFGSNEQLLDNSDTENNKKEETKKEEDGKTKRGFFGLF